MTLSMTARRLAGVAWAAIIIYPLTQLLVAASWFRPGYSWRDDYISSLGNTACGSWGGRYVCSPQHEVMNGVFIVTGLLMLVGGCVLVWLHWQQRWLAKGFALQALGGIGAIIVGVVPENSGSWLHGLGAALPFIGGNIGLVLLGIKAQAWPRWLRRYTLASGAVALLALALFMTQWYLGLGRGGMERVVDGLHTGWMIVLGVLLLANVVKLPKQPDSKHKPNGR